MPAPIDGAALAARLRQIRLELYGVHGAPELARRLELPTRTWLNYESGVVMPGPVLLRFLILTDVEPAWLAGEAGPTYRSLAGAAGREEIR